MKCLYYGSFENVPVRVKVDGEFVDATIVRIVLVPATMKLLGDNNWWIPAWLDRLIPHIDIEGDSALPSPEFEPVEHDGEAPITHEPVLV